MNIKIAVIGLILFAGIMGAYFIARNPSGGDINLSNLQKNVVQRIEKQEKKSQSEFKIENPIQWLPEIKSDYIAVVDENKKEEFKNEKIENKKEEDKKNQNNQKQDLSVGAQEMIISNNQPLAINNQFMEDTNINPNLANLEYMISEMKKVGKKQGTSDDNLIRMEKIIREVTATSTDLTAEFFKIVNTKRVNAQFYKSYKVGLQNLNTEGFFEKILTFLGIIKIADAVAPLPFGGKVVMAIPCTCTGGTVWYVTLTPFPPTYATLLSYIIGTQLYLSYIPIPHTAQNFVGFYEPIPSVTCWMTGPTVCNPLPDWGIITPRVGSSFY